MIDDLRVVHFASLARSGETVLQRALGAHSRIHIVGQLVDTPAGREGLAFFRSYDKTTIPATHPIVSKLGAKAGDILLVKQGVWEHRYPFEGFVLARNPVAVYASLWTYDSVWRRTAERLLHSVGWDAAATRLNGNYERFYRWAADVDTLLVAAFRDMDSVEVFCAFFNRRMAPLADLGLPILRYEDFVAQPERSLRTVSRWLGVDYEDAMLHSHVAYREGQFGHGGIPLWQPITQPNQQKHLTLPKAVRRRITGLTITTWRRLGYHLDELGEGLLLPAPDDT